jgi:hypothetical protein
MGKNEGWATLYFNTFDVPDDIVVSYEGTPVLDTDCIGTTAFASGCIQQGLYTDCCDGAGKCGIRFRYGPGSTTSLNVMVNPNCSGIKDTTEWSFELTCPE